MNVTTTGTGYSLIALTTPTNISGRAVSFTGKSSAFNVVSYNPTKQVSLTAQIEKALTGIDAEIFYLIVSVATVIYEIIKFARRKEEDEDTEDNEAGLYMEAMTMFEVLLLNAQKYSCNHQNDNLFQFISFIHSLLPLFLVSSSGI